MSKYLSLKNAVLRDYSTLDIDNVLYSLNTKKLVSSTNTAFGMKSGRFSKSLFQLSSKIWSQLQDEQANNQSVIDWKSNNVAIINDSNELIGYQAYETGVIESITDIINKVNKSIGNRKTITMNTNIDKSMSCIITNKKNNTSLAIVYYPDYESIYVWYMCLNKSDNVYYINPEPIIKSTLDSSIEVILDVDYLVKVLTELDLTEEIDEFNKSTKNVELSIQEISYFLSKFFDYKYGDPIEDNKYLVKFLDELKDYSNVIKYSSYLKKSITFGINFKSYSELLALSIINGDQSKIWAFSELYKSYRSRSLNYYMIND